MKWITVKLGEIVCAKLSVEEVLLTELRINNIPIITWRPLVIPPGYTLTISVEEKP